MENPNQPQLYAGDERRHSLEQYEGEERRRSGVETPSEEEADIRADAPKMEDPQEPAALRQAPPA